MRRHDRRIHAARYIEAAFERALRDLDGCIEDGPSAEGAGPLLRHCREMADLLALAVTLLGPTSPDELRTRACHLEQRLAQAERRHCKPTLH